MLTKDQYDKEERKQTVHRGLNTLLICVVLVLGVFFIKNQITPLYERISGIEEQRAINTMISSEIVQIGRNEGYRRCVYKDTKGIDTVGWGHRMLPHEKFKCIDSHYAVELLRKDYKYAQEDVWKRYPWANMEVRLILINMTFNMGSEGVANFEKTLAYLKEGEYDKAAGEVLDSQYAIDVPNRAALMATRMMALQL